MENLYAVNVMLGIFNYVNVVNEIAAGYFDDEHNYIPHLGLINAMKVFYNYCVDDRSKFDPNSSIIDGIEDIDSIFNDDEFLKEFNGAIIVSSIRLDFANAFRDALDIVNTNKSPINIGIQKLKGLIKSVMDSINASLTPENIGLVEKLKSLLESGEFTVDKFIESYGDSELFQKLLDSNVKDKKYVKDKE